MQFLIHIRKRERERELYLICSLITASQSSEYFCRAIESCGTDGTSINSFFTSSKGSKTTPVKGRWFAFFAAAHTTPFNTFAGANTPPICGITLSPEGEKTAGEALRNIIVCVWNEWGIGLCGEWERWNIHTGYIYRWWAYGEWLEPLMKWHVDGEDLVDKQGAWRAHVISGKATFGFDWNP